jgi:hypothetical protein
MGLVDITQARDGGNEAGNRLLPADRAPRRDTEAGDVGLFFSVDESGHCGMS